MSALSPRCVGLIAFALMTISMGPGTKAHAAAPPQTPQYLTFQIFTAGPGMTTEEGKHVFSRLPAPNLFDDEAMSILDAVGERGDPRHLLGIMVGPVTLDYSDAQLRTLIEQTFEVASKHKIAVGFHIDDSKFWMNRSDLWRNPANVEWLNWKGVPNTGRYLNWGEPWKLAPQACFNSPAMIKEADRLTRTVIGPAIAAGIANLRRSGEEDLFAGVIVGWETEIGRDFDTGRQLGYCALTNLGYSEKSPPPNFDAALQSIVQAWIDRWSSGLADAGVPTDKIYSHIAVTAATPPLVAFGRAHLPGFSTYPSADALAKIYAALKAQGNPQWASAEGANVDIQAAPPRVPDETMEGYLARMFNHGATLTNVFGWDVGDSDNIFRRAAESPQSIEAYRKFLRGAPLEETPFSESSSSDLSVLQRLIRALPDRIQSYIRAGGSETFIRPKVAELDKNMKEGRLDALKSSVDQIEGDIDAQIALAAKAGFDMSALQRDVRALPEMIAAYQGRNGDMNRIRDKVASIQKHIDAGELETAYEEVQALKPILASR